MGILDAKIRLRQYEASMEEAKQWEERDTRLLKKLQNSKTNTTITDVAESSQQQIMDVKLLEAAENGDVDNFITCLEKFSEDNNTCLSNIFRQLTHTEQDTFLHVAVSYGHYDLTTYIAYNFSQLLTCRNHQGDSALHLATRVGDYHVVEILLRVGKVLEKNQNKKHDLLTSYRLKTHGKNQVLKREEETLVINDDGNTALHESMLYDHNKYLVFLLIESNVEAAYYVNKQGKSPLYLAVESGNLEYVEKIFYQRSECMHLLDEQLVKGKSLLHAAIRRKSLGMPPYINSSTYILKI